MSFTKPTRYSRVSEIIWYLRAAGPNERSIESISRSTGIPYSTTRMVIKEYYPHCFREKPGVGWFLTGAQPDPDIAFDFNPPERKPAITPAPVGKPSETVTTKDNGQKGWIWDQAALRYLDTLWPGMTFAEVLDKAVAQGNADQLVVLGKTLTKAAMEVQKHGNANFLRG